MRRVCAVLLIPLALPGCAGSHTTQAESAEGTADTLVKSCVQGRPKDALEVLTPSARDFLLRAASPVRGCVELLGLSSGAALRGARVVSVHANDLSATAELEAPDGRRSHLELEKSRGVWAVEHGR